MRGGLSDGRAGVAIVRWNRWVAGLAVLIGLVVLAGALMKRPPTPLREWLAAIDRAGSKVDPTALIYVSTNGPHLTYIASTPGLVLPSNLPPIEALADGIKAARPDLDAMLLAFTDPAFAFPTGSTSRVPLLVGRLPEDIAAEAALMRQNSLLLSDAVLLASDGDTAGATDRILAAIDAAVVALDSSHQQLAFQGIPLGVQAHGSAIQLATSVPFSFEERSRIAASLRDRLAPSIEPNWTEQTHQRFLADIAPLDPPPEAAPAP